MPDVAPNVYLVDPIINLTTTAGTVVTTYDITSQVSAIEIVMEATVLGRTTFGNTWHRNGRGLKKGTIKFEFYLSFDAASTWKMFNTMWNSFPSVGFTCFAPGAQGLSGTFVMNQMPSFNGSVDEYNVHSLTFPLDGVVSIGAT